MVRVVELLAAALYPRRLERFGANPAGKDAFVAAKLIAAHVDLEREVAAELGYRQQGSRGTFDRDQPATIVRLFGATLPGIRELIDSDVDAAFRGDPAARTTNEILVC